MTSLTHRTHTEWDGPTGERRARTVCSCGHTGQWSMGVDDAQTRLIAQQAGETHRINAQQADHLLLLDRQHSAAQEQLVAAGRLPSALTDLVLELSRRGWQPFSEAFEKVALLERQANLEHGRIGLARASGRDRDVHELSVALGRTQDELALAWQVLTDVLLDPSQIKRIRTLVGHPTQAVLA